MNLPESLYHGTTASALDKILEVGIRPRGESSGNWTELPSRDDHVYMTTVFAPFYAARAAHESGDRDWLVVEIDPSKLDPESFFPDEDFLAYVISRQDGVTVKQAMDKAVATAHMVPELAANSLKFLGSVAYSGTVPVKAIRRVAVYRSGSSPGYEWAVSDTGVNVASYSFLAPKHQVYLDLLFKPFDEVSFQAFEDQFFESKDLDRLKEEYAKVTSKVVYL